MRMIKENNVKPLFTVIPTLLLTLACVFPAFANQSNNILDYASTKDIRDINPHLYSGEMAAQTWYLNLWF